MTEIIAHETYCVVQPRGPLSAADFDAIAQTVDPIIERNGRLGGLVILTREFPGWEGLGDAMEHFRFVKTHHDKIARVALVTDATIGEIVPAIAGFFVSAEVRHFDFDDFDEAIDWVS